MGAIYYLSSGASPENAINMVREECPGAIESKEQVDFIVAYEEDIKKIFPWEDVSACRGYSGKKKIPWSFGKKKYLVQAKPCPRCGKKPDELYWIYFESPEFTWELLCGRAGWLTICDTCHYQVNFFLEKMS